MTGSHNKVHDSLDLMSTEVITSYSVLNQPNISSRRDRTGPKLADVTINATSDHAAGLHGDLQIRHLWQSQTETIIDDIMTDTDDKTYISHPLYVT